MSSFNFIKKRKQPTNSSTNLNNQNDIDSKLKNQDIFNGAPAQPAQSFNPTEPKPNPINLNQPPQKKGFGFIKKKATQNNANNNTNNINQVNTFTNTTNILEKSNTSINSNDAKFGGINPNNNNNNNFTNDLDSLINNTNDLLNMGKINNNNNDNLSNSNNNININTMGEIAYQTFGNIEDDLSQGAPSSNSLPIYNNVNQEQTNNNNNFLNNNEKEKEKPKEKKTGFSFIKKSQNKPTTTIKNDSNKNVPYIANKTPLSSSMSDKVSEKSGNQNTNLGYTNINETPIDNENNYNNYNEVNNDINNNDNEYMDMNNNLNEIPKPREEPEHKEEPKEIELTENSIKSKFNNKNNNFKNDYIKYINELHLKKLSLQSKENDLSLLNIQKENLIKEEQKAIDDNDYDKADNIENRIKDIKNKANEILLKIEEETHSLMSIKKKEIELNNNLLSDVNDVTTGYDKLKNKLEEKIDNFTNNELAKHEGENIRLEKLNEKLEFLKTNLEQDKSYINNEETKINNLIKGQSAGIFENLENLNKDKNALLDEIAEIKKKLQEKEKDLDKLNLKIENKEKEIDAIKSNFNYEFKKIDMKKKNYEDNLKDYEDQNIRYNNELKAYNEKDEQNKKYLEDLNKELNYYNEQINTNKNEYNNKKNDIEKKETLINEENSLHNKIFESNKKINEINEKIESHHSKIQVLNVNNKIMQGEINQIEIKLPALEEEKKSYVQIKNFKEAGRVSKELKQSIEKKNQNINKIEKNKKEIEKFEAELKKYQNDIENLEKENQQFEKDLDITKYKNLINALNTMNDFYNKGQKNGKIFDEINLTQEQINKLKIKDHVLQYIKDNANKEEEKTISINMNDNNNNGLMNVNNTTAVKNEGFTFDLFNGLNMDFNMNNNNNNNNGNEENENGDETGGYTGFQLMGDDDNKDKNNNNGNNDEEIQKKINELNEKIQNAVNVSKFFLINNFLFIER